MAGFRANFINCTGSYMGLHDQGRFSCNVLRKYTVFLAVLTVFCIVIILLTFGLIIDDALFFVVSMKWIIRVYNVLFTHNSSSERKIFPLYWHGYELKAELDSTRISLLREAASFSEMSERMYQSTWHRVPEDLNINALVTPKLPHVLLSSP